MRVIVCFMPDLADMTSPVRVALAREITIVARLDPDKRARLEVDLVERGYEDRTNAGLIEMAAEYGVASCRIDEITSTVSAEMRVVHARYHCRECKDERVIEGADGRWFACGNCNVVPADVIFDPARC